MNISKTFKRLFGALAIGFGIFMVAVSLGAFLFPEAVFVKFMNFGAYIWLGLAIISYPIAKNLIDS